MKTCKQCNLPKDLAEFHKSSRSKDGRARRCKLCANEYSADYRTANPDRVRQWSATSNSSTKKRQSDAAREAEIREWLNEIKASTPCADCGHTFPAVCMDFDHLRDKRKSIAALVSDGCSKEAILEEVAKCELVCANCHRIRTHASGRARPWCERKAVDQ